MIRVTDTENFVISPLMMWLKKKFYKYIIFLMRVIEVGRNFFLKNCFRKIAFLTATFIVFIPHFFAFITLNAYANSDSDLHQTPEDTIAKWKQNSDNFDIWFKNDPDGCDKVFNFLWQESKKGDLDARYFLLAQMTMMHGPFMLLPGASHDYITRQRHYIIMAVHSIGSYFDKKDSASNDSFSAHFYTHFYSGIKGFGPESDFGSCMKQSRSPECVLFVVKDERIPSFESFAKEIDLFIKAGYKAQCSARGHSD